MIRTKTVQLTKIKGYAYREKLPSGGASVVVVTPKSKQPGIASISKTSGKAIPTANTSAKVFTEEVFDEAILLTNGLPYRRYKKPAGVEKVVDVKETENEVEELKEDAVIVDSNDYQKVLDKYTDKKDKFNYNLFNKDLIQTANNSKYIKDLIKDGHSADKIRNDLVGMKLRDVTGNSNLSDEQVNKMVSLLDDIDAKGIFKDLNNEIRKWLADNKKN